MPSKYDNDHVAVQALLLLSGYKYAIHMSSKDALHKIA
jgi:hypothetical protein